MSTEDVKARILNRFDAVCAERDEYRQGVHELHAEIRAALSWIESGAEPAVAHHMLKRAADKWLPLLEAEERTQTPEQHARSNDA